MEIFGVGIPLQDPANPAPLSPVLLFRTENLKRPFFFTNPHRISFVIKILDLSQWALFNIPGLFAFICIPASKVLSQTHTHKTPPIYDVSPSHPISKGKPY
jgi:hypothetical protein